MRPAPPACWGQGGPAGQNRRHPSATTQLPTDPNRPNRQAYSNNLVDYHLVLDLLPPLAAAYFAGRLPASLSYSQVRGGVRVRGGGGGGARG